MENSSKTAKDTTRDGHEAANLLYRYRYWNESVGEPLGPLPPSNWVPDEYLYYRIGISAAKPKLSLVYDYCGWVSGGGAMNGIQPFLDALKDNYDKPGDFLTKFDERPNLSAPTIRVIKPCFVILDLTKDWNWQFVPAIEGMRTRDPLKEKYCGLVHVDETWNSTDITADPLNRTNIIYFSTMSVSPRAANRGDPFNLFVVFRNGGQSNPMTIDPDIKNDGGGTHG